jgi:hypothetical protein
MKNYLLFIIATLGYFQSSGQNNLLSLNGGYVYTNIKDRTESASGYRISLVYEIEPAVGNVLHGFSVGVINVKADVVEYSGGQPLDYNNSITTLPFYYAPKFLIGKGSLQGFIKGAFGMQFSTLKQTSPTDVFISKDAGLYGGLGAGGMKRFNNNLIVSLEYEWAYLSNSYYNDGFAHSVMLGVGKFLN